MFGLFSKKAEKKEVEEIKTAVQTGFNSVKQDINSVSTWVKHLDSKDSHLKNEISELKEELSSVRDELEEMRAVLSVVENKQGFKQLFKQEQTVFNKQTPFKGVLNSVQTGVQTAFLDNLSTSERAIVFVLMNSDMKLSYEDLAAMLGKGKATIRGQINTIRQKSEGLIKEVISENNKKRVYIPQDIKDIILKSEKVRVKGKKKGKNSEE